MPAAAGALPPEIERPDRVGHPLDPVDEQQRATVDSDVTRVLERANQVVDVATIVFGVVRLLDEHLLRTRVPGAGPVLVRPRQAEGEVRLATGEHLLERALEHAASLEPVVVVAEAFDPVATSELGLQRRALRAPGGRRSRARSARAAAGAPRTMGSPRTTLRHSVKPRGHHVSFSGVGWNWGR